jgi:hypothetical protein
VTCRVAEGRAREVVGVPRARALVADRHHEGTLEANGRSVSVPSRAAGIPRGAPQPEAPRNAGHVRAQQAGAVRSAGDRVDLAVAGILEQCHVPTRHPVHQVGVRPERVAAGGAQHARATSGAVKVERQEVAPAARHVGSLRRQVVELGRPYQRAVATRLPVLSDAVALVRNVGLAAGAGQGRGAAEAAVAADVVNHVAAGEAAGGEGLAAPHADDPPHVGLETIRAGGRARQVCSSPTAVEPCVASGVSFHTNRSTRHDGRSGVEGKIHRVDPKFAS